MALLGDHDWKNTPHDYGVCDNWEQITKRWPLIKDSNRAFIISLAEVVREDQSPRGGWRWHKWGEYIGTQQPTTEYLYDEPVIEEVLVFQLIEVRIPACYSIHKDGT